MASSTSLSLTTASAATLRLDALVVGVHSGDDGPSVVGPEADSAVWQQVADLADTIGFAGKAGDCTTVPGAGVVGAGRLVLVGLGGQDDLTPERVRRAAGAAGRALAGLGTAATTLSVLDLGATAEGLLLGGYQFDAYRPSERPPVRTVRLVVPSAARPAKEELRRAVITAESVLLARDLVNTPPNDLFPAAFAERAAAAAKAAGLRVEVLDEKALAKAGYGGILAVGGGSTRPPRLLRISHRPAEARRRVALVGKGITFDSGGLSLKSMPGMEDMTSDMAGAAAVVATVIGAAALALPVEVTATVPLAENLPSGSAYRPADVITHYAPKGQRGTTSHILNTDAEGRIILADAIVRACEDRPDVLLETATLTGAQLVALGERTMGVMGSPVLRDRVAELARECGEDGWAMPLPEHLREGLDSYLADLQNVAGNRFGGMLVAGHYLSAFVADGVDWAHLDVAGPAFHTGRAYGYTTRGGTGVPVRTLLATLHDLAR